MTRFIFTALVMPISFFISAIAMASISSASLTTFAGKISGSDCKSDAEDYVNMALDTQGLTVQLKTEYQSGYNKGEYIRHYVVPGRIEVAAVTNDPMPVQSAETQYPDGCRLSIIQTGPDSGH